MGVYVSSSSTTAASAREPTADEILAGVDLNGHAVIVTGASSGVGAALASSLAGAGADVTLAVRDTQAGQRVAGAIARERGVGAPAVEHIDLLSLASVRDFCTRWGSRPLHLLINNAGLMAPPLAYTKDGFESQMSVNFFAPFLLSELLLPNLSATAPARVVTVSSGSHHFASLHLEDLNYRERSYEPFEAYGHAKLCANLLAVEYSRRHRVEGVTMNVVTPGGVQSNLGRHVTPEDAMRMGWINEDGSLPLGRMRTPEEGAAPPVWAAVADELEGRGGLYIEDCAIAPFWQPPTPRGWAVTAESLDPEQARALWDRSQALIDLARDAESKTR